MPQHTSVGGRFECENRFSFCNYCHRRRRRIYETDRVLRHHILENLSHPKLKSSFPCDFARIARGN